METKEDMVLPTEAEINERWQYLNATMIMGDPFIHEFLMLMAKRAEYSIETMGVYCEGPRIHLLYNPYFLCKLKDEEVRWVLYHEVFHVALHHVTLRIPEDKRQQEIFNYGADLAINQLIKETSLVKKPDPKTIKPLFPEAFKFDRLLSMEQYVQLLWQWSEDNKNKDSSEKGEPGSGSSGGSGGSDDDQGLQAPDGGQPIDDHSGFQESEIIDQVIRNKVEEMMTQSKYWGTMSGQAKAMIEAAQKPKVKWQRQIRHQIGRFVIEEKQPTTSRPNRRYGYPFQGTTPVCVDRVLAGMDTSASVPDKALSQFFAELNKAKDHVPVDLVQFDWDIQSGPTPVNKKMKRADVCGRGGTNFIPLFELADKKRYKCLIVLTDGQAAAPPKPKYVKDVIWCLVGDSEPPVPWGKRIRIKGIY